VILHLVTDRRRLSGGGSEPVRCLVEQARFAVAAGIGVIQLRELDLEGRALAELASRLVHLTRGSRTKVVVNDRLDIAMAAGADGVHLRGTSFDAVHVRACCRPGFLVGRSVHTVREAEAAGPVDYLIAGTIWPSASKPLDRALLGVEGLARIASAVSVPVLAIGGIQPDRAGDVARAGAAGIAAIGAWMSDAAGCRAMSLNDRADAFRSAFDAANMERERPSA
jgi:thiamine-phosphate pyrophosphorylase